MSLLWLLTFHNEAQGSGQQAQRLLSKMLQSVSRLMKNVTRSQLALSLVTAHWPRSVEKFWKHVTIERHWQSFRLWASVSWQANDKTIPYFVSCWQKLYSRHGLQIHYCSTTAYQNAPKTCREEPLHLSWPISHHYISQLTLLLLFSSATRVFIQSLVINDVHAHSYSCKARLNLQQRYSVVSITSSWEREIFSAAANIARKLMLAVIKIN